MDERREERMELDEIQRDDQDDHREHQEAVDYWRTGDDFNPYLGAVRK